jgi:Asp-tRNA(Asn)/Glu-tRNA(Gln) amidotransferase A subunit family amidase
MTRAGIQIGDHAIAELRTGIDRGELDPVDLVRTALGRISHTEDKIHAFAAVLGDEALAVAQQQGESAEVPDPLGGIPGGSSGGTAAALAAGVTVADLGGRTVPILPASNALTVPADFGTDGPPIGLQLMGAPGADATVLAAARAFEALVDYVDRTPAL